MDRNQAKDMTQCQYFFTFSANSQQHGLVPLPASDIHLFLYCVITDSQASLPD